MQNPGEPVNHQEPPFISVKDTAQLLGCSKLTVYRRFHAGQFPGRKVGSKIDLYRQFVTDLAAEIRSCRPVDVDEFASAWTGTRAAEAAAS
jgi:excisionase family DNA binding protein